MSIQTAMFPVWRGTALYKCKGSDLKAKTRDSDLILCQQGEKQYTFNRTQIDDLNVDAVDRKFDIVRTAHGMDPTNGVYNSVDNIFIGGEFKNLNHRTRDKWSFEQNGDAHNAVTCEAGDMYLGFGKDAGVVCASDTLFRPHVDIRDADTWQLKGPDLRNNASIVACFNRSNGVTQYISVGNNIPSDTAYLYNGFSDFTDGKATTLNMGVRFDPDLIRMVSVDKEGILYGLTLNHIYEYRIDDPHLSKKVFNGITQLPNFTSIYCVDGYYYALGKDRVIFWGRYGALPQKYTMPKKVGDKDWGFYPPTTSSISGDDEDEVMIGGQYGALYTCKRTDPNPALWDWEETIHTAPDGTAFRFAEFVSDKKGTYLALASEYYLMSTLPEFIVPVTDTDGKTYKVNANKLPDLFA